MAPGNRYFSRQKSEKNSGVEKNQPANEITCNVDLNIDPKKMRADQQQLRRRLLAKAKNKSKGLSKKADAQHLLNKEVPMTLQQAAHVLADSQMDPFPDQAPLDAVRYRKFKRVSGNKSLNSVQTDFHRKQQQRRSQTALRAAQLAARSDLLKPEEAGFLVCDGQRRTYSVRQEEIVSQVDVASAQKMFDLRLTPYGPYSINYTRNGRHLLLGGRRGHVAALDWVTKRLHCEFNVMEPVAAVQWLHQETMFAVAQQQYTYIYDNQGIELHCLKVMSEPLCLQFLPFHFLLVSCNARGFLTYVDTSIGQKVADINTKQGRLSVMCQNPANAVIHLGQANGVVSLWTPSVNEPVVKILCHRSAIRALAVNPTGLLMASAGTDGCIKVWDLRYEYRPLVSCRVTGDMRSLAFSQRNLLAFGRGAGVQIMSSEFVSSSDSQMCSLWPKKSTSDGNILPRVTPYLGHLFSGQPLPVVQSIEFCPFEDVLGVGHAAGFSSLLIPGAGEPNFDALEANPYETKQQRQQHEVQMLLDKVQPELINVDTQVLARVNRTELERREEHRLSANNLRPRTNTFRAKQKERERAQRSIRSAAATKRRPSNRKATSQPSRKAYSALDRFSKRKR